MPEQNEQILQRARELIEKNRLEDARIGLLELLQKEPKNEPALMILGGAYFTQQKYNEAEMVFERLILIDPGKGEYSIALFNTLWKTGRKEEALEEIKRFMEHADKQQEKATLEQYMGIIQQIGGH